MTERGVAVLVVAYGAPDDLAQCLTTLDGAFDVTVVDNSSNGAVRRVTEAAGAAYFDPGTNLGFAGGVNYGMRRIDEGVDVLLLNPDAAVSPSTVHQLHKSFETAPRLAAVSPPIVDARDHSPQRVAWPFPTPARMWRESFSRGWSGPEEYLTGTCLLIRHEAWDDVGAFDERFFLYAEEADWQRRAALRGWHFKLVACTPAMHVGAGTSTDMMRRDLLFYAAAETYVRKWHGGGGWLSYRTAAIIGSATRAFVGRGLTRSQAHRRLAVFLRGPRRVAGLPPL